MIIIDFSIINFLLNYFLLFSLLNILGRFNYAPFSLKLSGPLLNQLAIIYLLIILELTHFHLKFHFPSKYSLN